METINVSMTVNGKQVSADVENRTLLVQYLRKAWVSPEHTWLRHQSVRACTVHIDGLPIKSCSILARQVEGKDAHDRGSSRW